MRFKSVIAVAFGAAILGGSAAHSATVTSNTFTGAATNDFGTGVGSSENIVLPAGSTRSFVLNGVNVTYTNASNGSSTYEALGATQLWDNGVWGGGTATNGYISAFNGTLRNISFAFDSGVSQIGAMVNYVERFDIMSGARMEVFDINGDSLEVFDLIANAPISTPGTPPANHFGEFRGFDRALADIYRFEYTGINNIVLDDLTLSGYVAPMSAVPVPAGLPLLLAGLGMLGLMRRALSTKTK